LVDFLCVVFVWDIFYSVLMDFRPHRTSCHSIKFEPLVGTLLLSNKV
jgi:hypothetical protein